MNSHLQKNRIRGLTTNPAHREADVLLTCGALALLIASLVLVAILSTEMLSAARGYTQGEAPWSKGQKDAIVHLAQYARTRSEAEL
ncbi:MAG TPA: hypothetical protein VMH81_02745 [Bryobacteraceae bacterium]|nr:hypothetical protein [Bryobacteraceae bacterium]